jgi:hypothetical protein
MVAHFGFPQFEYDPDAHAGNYYRNPELGQSCPYANRPFHFCIDLISTQSKNDSTWH